MAIREYKCSACRYKWEVSQPIQEDVPLTRPCPRCEAEGKFQFPLVAIMRSSCQNKPIDVQVGADAERKWQVYHDRQEERNRVRRETGSMALTEIDGTFIPTPDSSKALREQATEARKSSPATEDTYYQTAVKDPSVD